MRTGKPLLRMAVRPGKLTARVTIQVLSTYAPLIPMLTLIALAVFLTVIMRKVASLVLPQLGACPSRCRYRFVHVGLLVLFP